MKSRARTATLWRAIVVIPLTVLLVLGALASSAGAESSLGYDRQEVAATLKVPPYVSPSATTLSYTLRNVGRSSLSFGLRYRLERRTGGQWEKVALPSGLIPAVAITLLPGGSRQYQARLPDLDPGRYRFVKPLDALELRAQFVIRRPVIQRPRLGALPSAADRSRRR